MYTVYALEDQRYSGVHAVFYIGITRDVYTRFSQHLKGEDNNIDKNEKIQELRDTQTMLVMRTIETVSTLEKARERENYWIHHYLSLGIRLLNIDIARSFTYDDFLSFFGRGEIDTADKNQYDHEDFKPTRKGLTASSAAKLRCCQKRGLGVTHIRSAIKDGTLRTFSDGSISIHAVEKWAKSYVVSTTETA